MKPKVLVITGPTATGKTAAGIALARRFDGELVGADSVQVVRGFDIGSGKATKAELGDVAHHLIDVLPPSQTMDAARYAALADEAIADIAARGRVPIVVGGTPLWLRALLRGLVELPPSDAQLRAELAQRLQTLGAPALHAELAAIDPTSAQRIHPNDALRIGRALEIHAQTGRVPSELWSEHALGAPRHHAWTAYVDLPPPEADEAIERRVDGMLAAGLVAEAQKLIEAHPDAPALGAVGYAQARDALAGAASLDAVRQPIVWATRRYAKQQRTWWKRDPSVTVRTTSAALVAGAHDEAIRAFLGDVPE